MPEDTRAALWYWRHYSLCVEVHASEAEAAHDAVTMDENGDASIAGVQHPDRSFVPRDEWKAFKAENGRRWETWKQEQAEREQRPKPPTRKIRAPFGGHTTTVLDSEPDWLGAPDA